jgi:hypothetical protein
MDTGFPKKIMLKQKDRARCRFNQNASRSRAGGARSQSLTENAAGVFRLFATIGK